MQAHSDIKNGNIINAQVNYEFALKKFDREGHAEKYHNEDHCAHLATDSSGSELFVCRHMAIHCFCYEQQCGHEE